ncbi:hypothetical protein BGX20_003582 [Mortierella sp. AD010]|nr:hypothetical protein BGX20_003582 [Mortierella sp. AD010]
MIGKYIVTQIILDEDLDTDSENEGLSFLIVGALVPADFEFGEKGRKSFGERYQALGDKWVLQSGVCVENVLYLAGIKKDCETYSFMIDIDDESVKKLFSVNDWKEITADLPSQTPYSEEADHYMDSFHDVKNVGDLEKALKERPDDPESLIVYHCLGQWPGLYMAVNPSPFSIVSTPGEAWRINNAWGVTMRLTNGLPHAFILPGEKSGLDSAERKNKNITPEDRRRIGDKADLIWRTVSSPEHDWAVAEAVPNWDPIGKKYRYEGTFKLPRQLHDILTARSDELGKKDHLRSEFVSGMIGGMFVLWLTLLGIAFGIIHTVRTKIGYSPGPVVQRASTIRLHHAYETAEEKVAEEKRQTRRREGRSSSISIARKETKFRLLRSSP